jgi:hypothetical protein
MTTLAVSIATRGSYRGLGLTELSSMRAQTIASIQTVQKGESVLAVTIAGKTIQKQLPTLAELKEELKEITTSMASVDPLTYGVKRRRFTPDFRFRHV